MLQKRLAELLECPGRWRTLRLAMMAVVMFMAGAVAVQLARPVHGGGVTDEPSPSPDPSLRAPFLDPNSRPAIEAGTVLGGIRRGLFRSAAPVRDVPMADKTIERIRSQLKLQCVMEMNGEPVAYIQVKDLGLKRCRVGDSVEDLFKVLRIQKKSVEIAIVDHSVTLSL